MMKNHVMVQLFALLLPLSIFINVIVGLLWIVMVIERKKDDENDKKKETNAGVIFGSTFGPNFFLTNANLGFVWFSRSGWYI